MATRPTHLDHLRCSLTGERLEPGLLHGLSPAGRPILCEYDLAKVAAAVTRETIGARPRGMWRWRELMPLPFDAEPITLGEGDTPLLPAPRLGALLGLERLSIKDESCNPTGSFKARGLSAAVTMAVDLGARALGIPSAGNAGGALAAYAARAGVAAHVYVPADTPEINRLEVTTFGARLELVQGLISDCGKRLAAEKESLGLFDVSTLKEPYRLEGKKTMGLELAEQLGWRLPDVIVYPTGGGTGLVGMHKAFAELETLGWIGKRRRPRFVSVQAEGCAPIVRAFESGAEFATPWENAATAASGLRVPGAVGDFLMLRALRETGGTAVAVSEAALLQGMRDMAVLEGVSACPEGGACVAALRELVRRGWVHAGEEIVLFNTGTGTKYAEVMRTLAAAG